MKKFLLTTAALAAAVAVLIAATIPPRRIQLSDPADGTVAGMLHVHSNRSDGSSAPDVIAAAAARAGLKFLVFTDHGDATRSPDPPTYRSGVLCLDGVEISTNGGHYIALDMPASPYPLGGEAHDVVEDVRRLGGFGIVAHPDSPKEQLRWTAWDAPFDAVELTNPDTSWRLLAAHGGWGARGSLVTALFDYPFRPAEVIARLIQPTAALEEWERLTLRRRVVTTAGADAHARLAPRSTDPGDSAFALPIPGYEASFRVLSVHVRPDRPLSGNAAADATLVVRAIRSGRIYTAIDGLASPPSFDLTATNRLGSARAGDVLGVGGPVQLRVQSNAPAAFTTIVRNGTRAIASARDASDYTVHGPDGPGVFWAEILTPEGKSWLRSNPVYVRGAESTASPPTAASAPTAAPAAAAAGRPLFDGRDTSRWTVEHDAQSLAALEVAPGLAGGDLRFRFGLGEGPGRGQYASAVVDLPDGIAPHDAVRFAIRAERAMRISLQVRDTTADRWQKSVYLDVVAQDRTIALRDLLPVGTTHVRTPAPEAIRTLMFVVDTTNTKPGTSGRFWIRRVDLVTSEP